MAVSTQQPDEHKLGNDFPSLKDHLLVAMPGLTDPFFRESVTYIIQHDEEGAMGVMINQPMPFQHYDLLKQFDLDPIESTKERAVLSGGPVQIERGFVLHKPLGKWESSMAVTDKVAVTTSMDILKAIARGKGPKDYQLLLGYAGWEAGQLDQEMLDNSWLTVPADETILFDTPMSERWQKASQLLGVDIHQLTTLAGHC
jgi:putative transcriptional regulator